MGIFFTDSQHDYIGKILRQLNSGMSLGDILAGMTWRERAKLLINLKVILRCQQQFVDAMKNL